MVRVCLVTLLLMGLIISGCSNNDDEVEPAKQEKSTLVKKEGDDLIETEEKQEDPILGKIENNIYTNTYLNITYPFSDDWQANIEEYDENDSSIAALYAYNYINGDSINIVLEKYTDESRKIYKDHSESEIVEESLKDPTTFIESCKELGMSDIKVGSSDVSCFNENHKVICIDGMIGEEEYHIIQLLLTKHEDYTILITVTSSNGERVKNTIKKFAYIK